MPIRLHSRTRFFTIVEVLVVIAIIAILVTLLVPVLAEARREALIAKCTSNLKQIATGLNVYVNKHLYVTPESYLGGSKYQSTHLLWDAGRPTGLGLLYDTGVVQDTEVLFCPGASFFRENGDYGMSEWGSAAGPENYVASSYLYRAESAAGSLLMDRMSNKAVVIDYNRQEGWDKNYNHAEGRPVMVLFGDGQVKRVDENTELLIHSPEQPNLHQIWYNADATR